MARYTFSAAVSAASQTSAFSMFTDEALSVAATDLLDESGHAVTVAQRDRTFKGPDGVSTLYARVSTDSGAPVHRFDATDFTPAPSAASDMVGAVA